MNYCYGKGVQNRVLCWEAVPFSESPLSEVPLYSWEEGKGRADGAPGHYLQVGAVKKHLPPLAALQLLGFAVFLLQQGLQVVRHSFPAIPSFRFLPDGFGAKCQRVQRSEMGVALWGVVGKHRSKWTMGKGK